MKLLNSAAFEGTKRESWKVHTEAMRGTYVNMEHEAMSGIQPLICSMMFALEQFVKKNISSFDDLHS